VAPCHPVELAPVVLQAAELEVVAVAERGVKRNCLKK